MYQHSTLVKKKNNQIKGLNISMKMYEQFRHNISLLHKKGKLIYKNMYIDCSQI